MSFTHVPTDDATWQESNECHAFDPDAGIGFVTASGAFANHGNGQAYVGAYLTLDDGSPLCFQLTDRECALNASDRSATRNGVSFLHWDWFDTGHGRLTVTADKCSIDVEFIDFYAPAHWADGEVPGATGHVESSGNVRGFVEIDGHRRSIDMLGHRDQSWGPRSLGPVRSHAWFAGTCGPDLSFTSENLLAQVGPHNVAVRSGFVVVSDDVEVVAEPDLVYGMTWDMRTPVEVHGTLVTESEKRYEVATLRRSSTFRNVRTWPEGGGLLTATDTLFEVRCGERIGIACLNLVTNHTSGAEAIPMLAATPTTEGVWQP